MSDDNTNEMDRNQPSNEQLYEIKAILTYIMRSTNSMAGSLSDMAKILKNMERRQTFEKMRREGKIQ